MCTASYTILPYSLNISAMPMTFSTCIYIYIYPHRFSFSPTISFRLQAHKHTRFSIRCVCAQLVLHVVHTSCDSFAVVAALRFRRHSVVFSWKRVLNRYASVFCVNSHRQWTIFFVRKFNFWTFYVHYPISDGKKIKFFETFEQKIWWYCVI